MTSDCGSPTTFATARDGGSEIWRVETSRSSFALDELSPVSTVQGDRDATERLTSDIVTEGRALLSDDAENELPSNDMDTDGGHGSHNSRSNSNFTLEPATNPAFAQSEMLRQYIPELHPDDARANTFMKRMAKRDAMLRTHFILATAIVAINLAALLWATLSHPPDGPRGVGTLRIGDCDQTAQLNTMLHSALNVLSSLFLGAGNYCMQVLAAPSRAEMDIAHAKGKSLDIGVPSVKNLKHIQSVRVYMWGALGLLSTCLNLFWNSTVFPSFPVVSYPFAFVTSDYQEAPADWKFAPLPPGFTVDNYNPSGAWDPILAMQSELAHFERIDRAACVDRYIDPLTPKRDLVVVLQNMTSADNEGYSLVHGWAADWALGVWSRDNWWMCVAYMGFDASKWRCPLSLRQRLATEWLVVPVSRVRKPSSVKVLVDYCLVGPELDTTRRCGLHYSVHTLSMVLACTLLQSILVLVVWRRASRMMVSRTSGDEGSSDRGPSYGTMVLMGDAISEYLRVPASLPPAIKTHEARWNPVSHITWFQVIGRKVWIISLILFAVGILVPVYMLEQSLRYLNATGADVSASSIWARGFKVDFTKLGFDTETNDFGLIPCVALANMFQIMVSFLYIFYNNILTRQLAADEWTRFLLRGPAGKKVLRVSSPRGMQRSSYQLSLPFKYSIPLLISMMVLHTLVSQSVFLVQTTGYKTDSEDGRLPTFDRTAVGYSHLGIILSITLGVLMVAVLLINSLCRRYANVPSDFPAYGASSAHMVAFCQRPPDDCDAHLFPVSLGVVKDGNGLQKLTFSTFIHIQEPQTGITPYTMLAMGPEVQGKHTSL